MLLRQRPFFLEIASASPVPDFRRQDSILRNAHLKAPIYIIHTHTSIIHIAFQSPSALIVIFQSVITGSGVAHAILLKPGQI